MNNPRRGRGRSGRRPNIPTRSQNFDSNGPEGRVRGNAQQVYEKYLALARDAQVSGDRVLAEAFQQHAEHYYRVMNDSTDPDFRPREAQQGQQRDERDDRQDSGDSGDDVGEGRGERRQQERGYDRRDDRYGDGQQERRSDERRYDERRQSEPRPNGQASDSGGLRQDAEAREGGRSQSDRNQGGRNQVDRGQGESTEAAREGDGREGRLRERFNRRNGEGILTRRRGGELDKVAEASGGGAEEEADAGLRKMLGGETRPQETAVPVKPVKPAAEAPDAPEEATAGEAVEPAPAKPRRRRRTKAEMEAKDSSEQTAE